jgi:hypothetical protein
MQFLLYLIVGGLSFVVDIGAFVVACRPGTGDSRVYRELLYGHLCGPAVIFRKVTGGFRSQWVARTYAAAYPSLPQAGCTAVPLLQAVAFSLGERHDTYHGPMGSRGRS